VKKKTKNAIRQERFREEQRKLGRSRVEYWITASERAELDRALAEFRVINKQPMVM
jgi:hypothetical protein